jgi:hypothetical protein
MPEGLEAVVKFLDPSWVFPVVAVLGLAWFVRSRWKTFGRIQALAKEMGITFSGADEWLALLPKQDAQVPNQEPSGLAWVLGLFGNWRLEGKFDGVPIRVHQMTERQAGSDDKRISPIRKRSGRRSRFSAQPRAC